MTRNGNYLINSVLYSLSSIYPSNTLFYNNTNKINWKTGWLEKEYQRTYFANGTIHLEYGFQSLHSKNFVNSLVSNYNTILEVGFLILSISTVVFLTYDYYSYSKISKFEKKKQSFLHFILKQIHYPRKKLRDQTITTTDEALKTIESILAENLNTNE